MFKKIKLQLSIFILILVIFPFLTIQTEAKQVLKTRNTIGDEIHLVLDSFPQPQSPRNFRKTSDISIVKTYKGLSTKGLKKLDISGSSQFSEQNFQSLMEAINTPLNKVIIDLRQESHGFINGFPVSWSNFNNMPNIGLNRNQVFEDETSKLSNIKVGNPLTFFNKPTVVISPNDIESEQQFLKLKQVSYIRIPITDGSIPDDASIDYFINQLKKQPVDIWLHFHCKQGVGRTTTFMIMYDMIKNAKNVSEQNIIKRQLVLDNYDDSNLESFSNPEKTKFFTRFYKYCKENSDNFKTSWSAWEKKLTIRTEKLSYSRLITQTFFSYIKNSSISVFLRTTLFTK